MCRNEALLIPFKQGDTHHTPLPPPTWHLGSTHQNRFLDHSFHLDACWGLIFESQRGYLRIHGSQPTGHNDLDSFLSGIPQCVLDKRFYLEISTAVFPEHRQSVTDSEIPSMDSMSWIRATVLEELFRIVRIWWRRISPHWRRFKNLARLSVGFFWIPLWGIDCCRREILVLLNL